MLRKIRNFLGSLRLTIILIVSLGAIFLLGLWIPQKGVLDYEAYQQWQLKQPGLVSVIESLGLMEIYRAPLTLAIWLLFFINLSLVIWQRLPVVRRRVAVPEPLPDPLTVSFPSHALLDLPDRISAGQIFNTLRHAGYVCHGEAERFYAVRNRLAPVASLLFHLSFFLMLLGGVISIYTRFVGTVDLAEGESFSGELERYNGKPSLPTLGGPPRFTVTVRKVIPLVEAQTPTSLQVTLEDDQSRLRVMNINSPYKTDNIFLVVKDLGLAPLFILRDRAGRELDGAYVKLNVLRGKEDGFKMGGEEFRLRFFPDYQQVNGEDSTRSEEFRNPVLAIMTVSGGKRNISHIPYAAGARIELGNRELVLSQQAFWVRLTVVSERGVFLVYAGFFFACAGLLWRFCFYQREIAGALTATGGGYMQLALAYRSEFYRSLGEEEFEQLLGKIGQSAAMESKADE